MPPFGALATPVGFDWDGDGDTDIISGNTAGYVAFIENLSGPKVETPKWAAPKLLEAGGKTLRIMAGPNGSIQGPCEAKWGYTTQTVADWDGDGLPDLVLNSILGKVVWYRSRRHPAGFQLLAISADQPAKLRENPACQALTYTLLSDGTMAAAKAFGIAFTVPDDVLAKYTIPSVVTPMTDRRKHRQTNFQPVE